ncbi:response regulator receiver domain protein [Leptospira wolbachii serovar Codice str. CDC]|uniref:Response regulator receiver domain protein n=1 Tax=Leptospira wolbachii serovar Codice str. CDC TaxID=1218599 RepID=R9A6I8_9LEPT|nr:response regulator transcription factor [Leptospira wolbachii]EOQ97644.1 response regulator receiver domain protein [Leptospira wolbachii serovar Codice str. CDC]
MTPKKKVLLVEDHAVTRVGVKHVVNSSPDFEVVGEAEHASQIAPLINETRPDFVLLDLRIPGENVLNMVKDWKKEHPNLKVVTLTMLDEQPIVHSAIEAGVDGYLLKSDDLSSLTKNLNEIAAGKTVYSKNLKLSFNRKPQDGKVANKKEKQILTLLGHGKTYQEIGTEIGLSKRTVEYHVGRLKDRFNAKTVAELIGRAKEQMLI